MLASSMKAACLIIKASLVTIYNDVLDEHLFVFAAGLSYYLVLSLFPLLVSMAALLAYVPIPHLFEGLLNFAPSTGRKIGSKPSLTSKRCRMCSALTLQASLC